MSFPTFEFARHLLEYAKTQISNYRQLTILLTSVIINIGSHIKRYEIMEKLNYFVIDGGKNKVANAFGLIGKLERELKELEKCTEEWFHESMGVSLKEEVAKNMINRINGDKLSLRCIIDCIPDNTPEGKAVWTRYLQYIEFDSVITMHINDILEEYEEANSPIDR